jgi:hypothetical protein
MFVSDKDKPSDMMVDKTKTKRIYIYYINMFIWLC